MSRSREWWRTAVIYQIYIRSFFDSTESGNGDLNGIRQNLSYLQDLGIGAIWINPFFRSPRIDQGYDPASYHKVDPMFGSNADMRRLIDAAHERGIKVILDLVLNHTSDQHPWFLRALKPDMRKRRAKSDYNFDKDNAAHVYVFRPVDPENPDKPPNNWVNFVGDTSAWTKTPDRSEWFLHKFHARQPDLNNANPLVTDHFCRIAQRWVRDQKIDGIRIDVLDHTLHDPGLEDFQPIEKPDAKGYLDRWQWQERYICVEGTHNLARQLSRAIKSANPDAISIGELHYGPLVADFRHYTGFLTNGEIDIPFNFSLLDCVQSRGADAKAFKEVIDRYIHALPEGACPNFVMSNHDQVMRLVDRVGEDNIRPVTMMLLSLGNRNGSNVFIYNGDEGGMTKGDIINESNMDDLLGKAQGVSCSRDHVRTGIVWDSRKLNGGYSKNHRPWLPGGETTTGLGIYEQTVDPHSQLNFTRDIIRFRRKNEALLFGEYIPYDSADEAVFCFGREEVGGAGQRLLMAFNFSNQPKLVRLPPEGRNENIVRSTHGITGQYVDGQLWLRPHEGCIVELGARCEIADVGVTEERKSVG